MVRGMKNFFITNKNTLKISVLMVLIMVLCNIIAFCVATNGFVVTIRNVSFYGPTYNNIVSANLFIPEGASATNKKPAVLAVHGYNNMKDMMTNTAIELARRGFVVLAMDMPGHGCSEGSSGSFNYATVDGLNYLRSLTYVDRNNIGMVGMSMGGWAIQFAAINKTDWYKSMFYMDSYVTASSTQWSLLKNVAIQMAFADEFNPSWLGATTGHDVPNSTLLKRFFGTTTPIEIGKVYGNITAGTARILYVPWINHPQSTETSVSISNVVSWFQMTLSGGISPAIISNTDMIFPYKQFFLSIGFVAAIVFIFTFGDYLLQSGFKDLVEPLPEYKGFKGISYWIAAVIVTALGPLLYLYGFGTLGPNAAVLSYILPMAFPNNYMAWMNLVASVSLVILLAFYYLSFRKAGVTRDNLGWGWSKGKIMKSLLFAILTLAPIYVTVAYCYSLFKMPFTLSGPPIPLVLLPLNSPRAFYLFSYFPTFILIYIIYGVVFAGFMRYRKGDVNLAKEMIINSLILSVGSIIFLLYYYIPLYFGMPQTLNNLPYMPARPGLQMIYFIPIPIFNVIAACVLTYFFRKTGKIWPGVMIMTAFMTWYMVAFSCFNMPLLV